VPSAIRFDPRARADFDGLPAGRRRPVRDAIRRRLTDEPLREDRHRRRLRPNGTADWEVWAHPQRILYDVEEAHRAVLIRRALTKPGAAYLDSRGREVDLGPAEA
jgi:mRNA-degrading endonuclease RelE of RelBE toxin-antitoxin system